MLSESTIISYLRDEFPEFIGDDSAVLPLSKNESYVLTKDVLVEDVHFRRAYYDPASLAHKALHVNLSDLAAMGARPQFVLLGLSIHESCESYIHEFLCSFAQTCKDCGVILMGGDTTKSPAKLFISITAIGIVPNQNIKYRHTAGVDDLICAVGNFGHAHVGLTAFERSAENFAPFKAAFLKPRSFLQEGYWFGQQNGITAMMDISDGLYIDLKRLCKASHVAAEVELDNLYGEDKFIVACKTLDLNPVITQLTGGEDYGLLVTVKPDEYSTVAYKFETNFGYALKPLGRLTEGSGVHFVENGQTKILHLQPFSHFGEANSHEI